MTENEISETEQSHEVLESEFVEETALDESAENNQISEHEEQFAFNEPVNETGQQFKSWRQDPVLILLVGVIGLSVTGLLLLILIPIIALLLGELGMYIPFLVNIAGWLGSGFRGLIFAIVLAVVAVVAIVILRRRVLNNPFYYLDAGCPQCHEHELIRVRRRRADRILTYIGIPAQRRVCRNCSWGGLRLGRLQPISVNLEQETVSEEQELVLADEMAGISSEVAVSEEG